jgi:glycosyltransferase involved in cell wall biosynthesis
VSGAKSAVAAARATDSTERRVKVLLLVSHPVQWNAASYRLYAADPRLDFTVAYCMLRGATPAVDRDFGVEVEWDVPLLDGYRWIEARNWSPRPAPMKVAGLINPRLWSIVRKGSFDVVVVCGYRGISYWIAALAARSARSTVVLTSDARSLGSQYTRHWKTALKRVLLPRIVRAFDAVLVPSTASADFFRQLGVPAQRVFTAPYVVDNDFFREGADRSDREAVRRRWAIPSDVLVALFCGKLVPWKRPQDLIAAAAQVPGVHVVYAGDGSMRSELRAIAERAGLADRVHFLGFTNQTQLPGVYRAADVLVLPSEHEPFGLVVNEAFASGIPAIVSAACGSAGDLVTDGATGYVLPVGDVEQLAGRLREIDHDRGLLRRLAHAATLRIEEWGPRQNAAAFAQACQDLAGLHP